MKGIRQERLDALIFAQEEVAQLYNLLEEIKDTTTCNETKERIDKFLTVKLEINSRLLNQ